MGIFTKDIKTMEDLFLHQLEDIYYAEQHLTKAIPKIAEMATNADLKAGLKLHVVDTQNQIERLDKVFAKLGQQPKGTDCPAIDGLIKEANATAGEIEDKAVLDAAIVANSPPRRGKFSALGSVAHDRRLVVRKHPRQRRQIADISVDHAKQRDDGGLVGRDRVEIAHRSSFGSRMARLPGQL
jgi:hypothetical protein